MLDFSVITHSFLNNSPNTFGLFWTEMGLQARVRGWFGLVVVNWCVQLIPCSLLMLSLWEGPVWFNAEFPFISQRGVCGCERGYTEVMRSNGFLDYCVKVPGLEDKKADVKTIAGKNKPVNSKMHDIFKGWSIQPFNPGEKLKYEWNRLSLEGLCRWNVQALWVITSEIVSGRCRATSQFPAHVLPFMPLCLYRGITIFCAERCTDRIKQ